MTSSTLGAFLSTCRAHVQPEDLGLRSHSVRRVAGLRREEVAMLAGISVDYYARLEQGRERFPSAGVLNALASALLLDQDQRQHLFRLSGLTPSENVGVPESVDQSLLDLLSLWSHTPSLVINRHLDILAQNTLAEALYSGFEELDNLARMTFLDPFGQRFFADWERAASSCVANLRLALGHRSSVESTRQVVAEIYDQCAIFREFWDCTNVRGKTRDAKDFEHPEVGRMTLTFNAFDVRSAPGLQLIVYQAAPGSASADKLAILGSLHSGSVATRQSQTSSD